MTLNHFLKNDIWRETTFSSDYLINNKAQIYSKKNNKILLSNKGTRASYNISLNGKSFILNGFKEILKVFHDVEIDSKIYNSFSRRRNLSKGIYTFNNPKSHKKYRVIIQKNLKQYLIGYFYNIEDAQYAHLLSYLTINNI